MLSTEEIQVLQPSGAENKVWSVRLHPAWDVSEFPLWPTHCTSQFSRMEDQEHPVRIQDLDDLQLAILSCLVAGEHCIIETHPHHLQATEDELIQVRYLLEFSNSE